MAGLRRAEFYYKDFAFRVLVCVQISRRADLCFVNGNTHPTTVREGIDEWGVHGVRVRGGDAGRWVPDLTLDDARHRRKRWQARCKRDGFARFGVFTIDSRGDWNRAQLET